MASIAYRIGDAAFIHDTLVSCLTAARRGPTSPAATRTRMWRSIRRIMAPAGRHEAVHRARLPPGRPGGGLESTVARQRSENAHLVETPTEDEFVAMREARDRELPMPKLILHSLQ